MTTQGSNKQPDWDDIDKMPEVADEDLFPYGHGPAGGD